MSEPPRPEPPSTDLEMVLGVPPGASPAVVRAAWRARARALHPDAGGDAVEYARVREAYEVLVDPDRAARWRTAYAAERRRTIMDRAAPVPEMPRHPRAPWSRAAAWPGAGRAVMLAVGAALGGGVVAWPGAGAVTPVATVLAAGSATAVAAACVRLLLTSRADAAHCVSVFAVAWSVVTGCQLVVAAAVGVDLISVLPLLALVPVVVSSIVLFPGRRRR